jgi:long-chain-fatty-acid--CoA ligase ACSBG
LIKFSGQIVGIYSTNSPDACYYILEKSKANIVVVDEDFQLDKILEIKHKLPHLKAVVKTFPQKKKYDGIWMWKELEEMNVEDFEDVYQARAEEISLNSCCCLVFTSGTTGN